MIYTGTAAWTIPKIAAEHFPVEGTHLERYSKTLNAVEINTTFYKDHMPKSFKKWADSTPADFRFSVKLNKRFTHECGLSVDTIDLAANLQGISELGEKWRVLLVQLPKSQSFNEVLMDRFYKTIRENFQGAIALEARNLTWMSEESIRLMKKYNISKVTADPEVCPDFVESEISYYRLHGSPEMYKSDYPQSYLDSLYEEMNSLDKEVWCIFDNTTFGYATQNAVTVTNKGDHHERYQRPYDNRALDLYTAHEH